MRTPGQRHTRTRYVAFWIRTTRKLSRLRSAKSRSTFSQNRMACFGVNRVASNSRCTPKVHLWSEARRLTAHCGQDRALLIALRSKRCSSHRGGKYPAWLEFPLSSSPVSQSRWLGNPTVSRRQGFWFHPSLGCYPLPRLAQLSLLQNCRRSLNPWRLISPS